MIAQILLLILAIVGASLCSIIKDKKSQENMVCHLGSSCENVLKSKYNKTFGIPNEFTGKIYYFIIGAFTVALLFGANSIYGIKIGSVMIVLSGLSFIFSLYLTGIQAFKLKSWCEYCIASAITNLLIFILTFFI